MTAWDFFHKRAIRQACWISTDMIRLKRNPFSPNHIGKRWTTDNVQIIFALKELSGRKLCKQLENLTWLVPLTIKNKSNCNNEKCAALFFEYKHPGGLLKNRIGENKGRRVCWSVETMHFPFRYTKKKCSFPYRNLFCVFCGLTSSAKNGNNSQPPKWP